MMWPNRDMLAGAAGGITPEFTSRRTASRVRGHATYANDLGGVRRPSPCSIISTRAPTDSSQFTFCANFTPLGAAFTPLGAARPSLRRGSAR
jgi:hypothetical protein